MNNNVSGLWVYANHENDYPYYYGYNLTTSQTKQVARHL